MNKTIYVIFNKEQKRPAISRDAFGSIIGFLSFENAQAYILDQDIGNPKEPYSDRYEIKQLNF